jgi:adenosine deaminase
MKPGRLAQYILDRRGFRVCLNTDDRLMGDNSMTRETTLATELFELSLAELEKLSLNAIKSAFAHYDQHIRIIFDVIKPGFAKIRARL